MSCRLKEEAPIKEKYTSWAPLSNDPLIHASHSFIFQRNTAGVTAQRRKSVHVSVCVVVTTHDSFHPSNGRVALNQSINKDQQSLFAHSSSISRFKILFSPLLPWLITPRHALSAAFSPLLLLLFPSCSLTPCSLTLTQVLEEKYNKLQT